jgi:hypothetical protein
MITIFNGRSRGLGSQDTQDIYVQISVKLRNYLHLFKGAKLNVFLAIALHSDTHGWSWPSTRTLHRETGLSGDTLFRALAELCELKIEGHRVLLRKQGRRTTNQYSSNNYLIFPTEEEISKYETPYLFSLNPHDDNGEQVSQGNTAVPQKSDTGQTQLERPARRTLPITTSSSNSKFRLEDIRKYAWSCEGIRNPDGWSITAQRSGEADELIEEFLNKRTRVRSGNLPPGPFETACRAVELAMSVNEISLAEAIARLREASSPTPGVSTTEVALTWGKILAAVKNRLQTESFETWFDPIRCEGIDGASRIVFLWAPNQVVRDWIHVNYSNLMDHALGDAGLSGYAIEWVTAGEVHPAFRELDEATVRRVINHFVAERGFKYEVVAANAEVA